MKYVKIVLILFTLTTLNLSSQEVLKLTIDNALQLAVKNNLDIKLEKSVLTEKQLGVISSYNKLLPTVNYSGTLSKSKILQNELETETTSLSSSFDLSLSINAKMFFDIFQTALDYQEGSLTFDIAKRNITTNVKKSYFAFKSSQEKIKLKEIEINNAKDKYNTNLKNYLKGEVSELDKLNSELSYKKLMPELLKLQSEYDNQLQLFKVMLGIPVEKNIELIDQMPDYTEISLDKIKTAGIKNNLKIRQLQVAVNKDINSQNIYISLMTPTFKIGYNLGSQFLKDPYVDKWFNSINDWKVTNTFSLSISVPVDPVFPLSQKQLDLIKSSFKIGRDELTLNNEKISLNINLNLKINKIKELVQAQEIQLFNIQIAEKAYSLTEKEYYNAQKTYLELKDAEKNLFESKINYLNSKYDLYTTVTDIESITNKKASEFFN